MYCLFSVNYDTPSATVGMCTYQTISSEAMVNDDCTLGDVVAQKEKPAGLRKQKNPVVGLSIKK